MEKTESIETIRSMVNESFERWLPRRCDEIWIKLVSDAPRFGWDIQAIKRGFIDPLYREFDSQPERWHPILAAKLLAVSGLKARDYDVLLAATELYYLAFFMLRNVRNSRTAADALLQDTIPFPVLVTVSYTARQLAPNLVFRHAIMLCPSSRSWLGYRFGRMLIQRGIGGAVDILNAEKGVCVADEQRYINHLKLMTCPLTFTVAADIVIAALNIIETPEARQLQQAAAHLGIAYYLATEIYMLKRCDSYLENLPKWSYMAAMGGLSEDRNLSAATRDKNNLWWRTGFIQNALATVQKHLDEMRLSLQTVRRNLSQGYESFVEAVIAPRIYDLEGNHNAK